MRQASMPFVPFCCPQHARRLGTIHAYSLVITYKKKES